MKVVRNPLVYYINKCRDYAIKKPKQLLLYVAVVLGFILLMVGYFVHRENVQTRAHVDFTRAMEYFNAPVVGKDSASFSFDRVEFRTREEKWVKVEKVFKDGFKKNNSSGLASSFLAFQSTALLYQGRRSSAINVLSDAIDLCPSKEISDYYRVKLALLKIDDGDRENGFKELKLLAANDKSVAHDWVLYEIGSYFWYENKFEEVKNYWGQLEIKYGKSKEKPSGFWIKAKKRLKLIKS